MWDVKGEGFFRIFNVALAWALHKRGGVVLRWSDGSVALLPSRVPYLGFNSLSIHLNAASSKLHSYGAFAFQVELVAGETGQKVTFPNTRVSNENNFKKQTKKSVQVWI